MQQPTVILATGGSGGHIFPALAVAEELRERGWQCQFLLGGSKFSNLVEQAGFPYHSLPAAKWSGRNIFIKAWSLVALTRAVLTAIGLIHQHRPTAVLGYGSFATVASIFAAKVTGVATLIHEQNVLPGRANTLLARVVDRILVAHPATQTRFSKSQQPRLRVVGNPLRQDVVGAIPLKRSEKPRQLMILGGSQGARILSQTVPQAVAQLPAEVQQNLVVVHQARPEDVEATREAYANVQLASCVVESFFDDLPQHLARTHILVSRAGALTVSEAASFGIPSIFVPLKLADNHQQFNAQLFEDAGAGVVLDQAMFNAETLLPHLQALLTDDDRLKDMSKAAHRLAVVDAAGAVGDVVERVAGRDIFSQAA